MLSEMFVDFSGISKGSDIITKFSRIHIMSIKALTEEDTFTDTADDYAIISCAERTNRYISLCSPSLLLQLSFADTANENDPRCFSAEHGKKIKFFVESLPPTVSDLFIFCDAGESRSTAIAAAILLWIGRSDEPVWSNPFYHPNTFVFGRLCEAFGIELTEEQIASKKRQSEDAFKIAMKGGTQYKRWEVI